SSPGRPVRGRSARAPGALPRLALSLRGLALARGLLELPSRPEPLAGLGHGRIDPRRLLERLRRAHALRGPGRFRQVRVGALEVLLCGGHGFPELLPLSALGSPPPAADAGGGLVLFSGEVGQRPCVARGGLLGRVGQALRRTAALQGGPDRRDLVLCDLLCALLLVYAAPLRRSLS